MRDLNELALVSTSFMLAGFLLGVSVRGCDVDDQAKARCQKAGYSSGHYEAEAGTVCESWTAEQKGGQ